MAAEFFDVAPRSQEWRNLRLGCVTSSEFDRVVQPKKLELSTQADDLKAQLLAEWISGESIEGYQSEYMIRGQELEYQIYKAYESYMDLETTQGGFYLDGLVGCSPDRRVGEPGLVETKAPGLKGQISYALNDGLKKQYFMQVQGQLMVTGREWCDLFAWHERLFIPPIRIFRDEEYIGKIRTIIYAFADSLLAARLELEERFGPFDKPDPKRKEEAYDFLGITKEDEDALVRDRFPEAQ